MTAEQVVERPGSSAWIEIEPAAVLPGQLTPTFRLDAGLVPEKRLMLAVLEDAVASFQKHACAPGRPELEEARAWFASDDRRWPFSFTNICEALGLDSAAVRGGLRRWRDRQRALAPAERLRVRHSFRRTNGSRTRATGRAPGIRLAD